MASRCPLKWAHGLAIALFVGIDKLNEMVEAIWKDHWNCPARVHAYLQRLRPFVEDTKRSSFPYLNAMVWEAFTLFSDKGGHVNVDHFLSVRPKLAS